MGKLKKVKEFNKIVLDNELSQKLKKQITKQLFDAIDFYSNSDTYLDSASSADDRYSSVPIMDDKGSQAYKVKVLARLLVDFSKNIELDECDYNNIMKYLEDDVLMDEISDLRRL